MSQNNSLSGDSIDSSYFKDMSNLMRNANDSSFLVHVDDSKVLPEPALDFSKQAVNWDEMDLTLSKKPDAKFGSFPDIPPSTNQDINIDESQFLSLNPDEAKNLFDKDGEARLRLNDSHNASFLNQPDGANSFLATAGNANETMGRYFYSKSSFPKSTKENLTEDYISNFWARPPPIPEIMSNFGSSEFVATHPGFLRSDDLKSNASQDRRANSEQDRQSVLSEQEKMEDRKPRPSISRLSEFFKSSCAEELDKNDIISQVLKFCKKQNSEEPIEYQREGDNLEDTFSQSLEPNMSGLIRTSQYGLSHSTPIKKSTQNLADFSLKTMCATGTSLERDILPRLSQLPSEIASSISHSRKRTSSISSKNTNTSGPDNFKRYTQSVTHSIKIKSGSNKRLSDSVPDAISEQRKPHSARQFQSRINESASSQLDSTNQSLITARSLKNSVTSNNSNRSTATSTCSTSCSTQTQQNQPQGGMPMFGYPIIVQVQCPHHQAPPIPTQCNTTQHSCHHNSQVQSQFQPWMQMPMMPMAYPQFPQHPMQPAQNCCNCQSTSNSNAGSTNEQTLAIESNSKSSVNEVKEVVRLPPKRGLPKIHIDKNLIRWGPTDLHLGEYTSLTIVNQSESALFLRCGIIQNSESKHFKIVSETYDRKIRGITLECEIPEGDVKVISFVFTPEKEKRYLGELHIKCRYKDHELLDGVFSCKLPLVGTGIKSSSHR